eukprot:scaffold825_cov30-Tisochrysis_lutea.AAC.1
MSGTRGGEHQGKPGSAARDIVHMCPGQLADLANLSARPESRTTGVAEPGVATSLAVPDECTCVRGAGGPDKSCERSAASLAGSPASALARGVRGCTGARRWRGVSIASPLLRVPAIGKARARRWSRCSSVRLEVSRSITSFISISFASLADGSGLGRGAMPASPPSPPVAPTVTKRTSGRENQLTKRRREGERRERRAAKSWA